MKHLRLIVLLSLLTLIVLLPSCSRSREEGGARSKSSSSKKAASISASLLKKIPTDSFGFVFWDAKHPAYLRLQKSPWYEENEELFTFIENSPRAKEVLDLFKKTGIDLYARKTWESLLTKTVVFISPAEASSAKPMLGMLFESSSDIPLAKRLATLQKELANSGNKVQPLSLTQGKGFSLKTTEMKLDDLVPGAGASQAAGFDTVYVGWDGQNGVLASSEALLNKVLGSPGNTLPTIVEEVSYQKATAGFPSEKERFATGFLDTKKLLTSYGSMVNMPSDLAGVSVNAVSLAGAMGQAPEYDFRLLYEESKDAKNTWLSGLKASSSGSLLAAIPASPLTFITIDGQTISESVNFFLNSDLGKAAASAEFAEKKALIDKIRRIGVAAKASAPGQSFLPVPDLLIVIDSSQPEELKSEVVKLISEGLEGNGMVPGMGFREKTIENVKVSFMMTPLQLGVFVATKGNLVLVTSNNKQMEIALKGLSSGGTQFVKSFSPRTSAVFKNEPSVGSMYVNFKEVAELLESMGALLGQFAPGNKEAEKWLEPDKITQLKKMGTMVATMNHDKGSIAVKGFYQLGS